MSRVEKVPGRRRASPPPRAARSDREREQPARSRRTPSASAQGTVLEVERPTPPTSPGAVRLGAGTVLGLTWVLGVGAATGGLIALRATDAADRPQQAVATALGALLAFGLSARGGGRPVPATLLALVLGGAAVATQWPVLLAGAAVGTAVLAACLAVLGTTPAASFRTVIREIVLAQSLAATGAVAAAGFSVAVDPPKFAYTVLALSLAATIAMVYRLGAGLHGLGRRGVVVATAAILVLAVALAYSEALGRWGAAGMTEQVDAFRFGLRDLLGAVPHPIEVLLGIPALTWGVFMRARRRQGWWVCAFGTAATAPATTRLIDVGMTPLNTLLSAVYSLVLGLALGYLLIRVDQALQGTHGRRARRGEEATAHRPEPQRLLPLH